MGVAISGSVISGSNIRAIIPINVLPIAKRGHSIGTPVRRKLRRAVFSSRAAMMRCIPAIEINQTGNTAKNHSAIVPQPAAPQSTMEAVSGSDSKCVTIPCQPPTSMRPIGTAMNTIPTIRITIWNTSVNMTALSPPIAV